MSRLWIALLAYTLPLLAQDAVKSTPPVAPAPAVRVPLSSVYQAAIVQPAKTSIYIGAVTLTMPPFGRTGDTFHSTYQAKVFPLFFYNEAGRIAITLSDDDLRGLIRGERVYFTGEAFSRKDEPRRVEGHADPANPTSGKIKVRVWVSKNIELIFNTTYHFSGNPSAEP